MTKVSSSFWQWLFFVGLCWTTKIVEGEENKNNSWYVSPTGTKGASGSEEDPFLSFVEALQVAEDGDVILAFDGIYSGGKEAGNGGMVLENYPSLTSQISFGIQSTIPGNVVLDFSGTGDEEPPFLQVSNGKQLDVTLQGYCFQNMNSGSVLDFSNLRSVGLSDVQFSSNFVGNGHCVRLTEFSSNFKLSNCSFLNNSATSNGAALFVDQIFLSERESLIFNCTFEDNEITNDGGKGGAVFISNLYQDITIEKSAFVSNSAQEGGALYSNDIAPSEIEELQLHIINTTFVSNTALNGGGALWVSGVEIEHCEFDFNSAGIIGGAIDLRIDQNRNQVLHSVFKNNVAMNGSAIHLSSATTGPRRTPQDQILGCTFLKNAASSDEEGEPSHGTIYVESGDILIANSIFNSNSADHGAGVVRAVELFSKDSFWVHHCDFEFNQANGKGGGIYITGYLASTGIQDCKFIQNTAGDSGGAIRFQGAGDIVGCHFSNNSARYGGGISITKGITPLLFRNDFVSNVALQAGGAIHLEADASTTLLQCTFTSNEVSNQNNGTGGAIAILDMEAPGFIEDCVFNSNNATEGTFIFIEEPTSPRFDSVRIRGSTFVDDETDASNIGITSYFSVTFEKMCGIPGVELRNGVLKETTRLSICGCEFESGVEVVGLKLGDPDLTFQIDRNLTLLSFFEWIDGPILATSNASCNFAVGNPEKHLSDLNIWLTFALFGEPGNIGNGIEPQNLDLYGLRLQNVGQIVLNNVVLSFVVINEGFFENSGELSLYNSTVRCSGEFSTFLSLSNSRHLSLDEQTVVNGSLTMKSTKSVLTLFYSEYIGDQEVVVVSDQVHARGVLELNILANPDAVTKQEMLVLRWGSVVGRFSESHQLVGTTKRPLHLDYKLDGLYVRVGANTSSTTFWVWILLGIVLIFALVGGLIYVVKKSRRDRDYEIFGDVPPTTTANPILIKPAKREKKV